MGSNKHFSHLVIFVLIFMLGCKSTKQHTCEIDVLITAIPEDSKLSEGLLAALLPFEDKEDAIVLPQGSLFNPVSKVTYIKEKNWIEKLRGNLTKNTTLLILSEKIKRHLSSIDLAPLKGDYKVDDKFIQQNSKDYDMVMYLSDATPKEGQLKFETPEDFHAYLLDSVFTKKTVSKVLLVYGRTHSVERGSEDTVDLFKKQIHDKLIAIAECKAGVGKVYEERIKLANEFNARYIDAATEIKQYAGEGGFYIGAHVGEAAARYVRSLAEQDLCMTDLVIVDVSQSATGKMGVIKVKEIQAKLP